MENLTQKTIGAFVADDFRTANVFQKYGIDFCCKGGRSIDEVCQKNNISPEELLNDLQEITIQNNTGSIDYNAWPLDLLADYIEKTHHRYVESSIPPLLQYLHKLCKVHGANHPELFEIFENFQASAGELTSHMKKEELVLFPFVRKMINNKLANTSTEKPHFGTVENPIAMMMQEHDNEGERFRTIAKLTNNYNPPADACNTYRVAFSLLKDFEADLHKHIHLENNILFPKAVALEKTLI